MCVVVLCGVSRIGWRVLSLSGEAEGEEDADAEDERKEGSS